jgi:hypothetical protein
MLAGGEAFDCSTSIYRRKVIPHVIGAGVRPPPLSTGMCRTVSQEMSIPDEEMVDEELVIPDDIIQAISENVDKIESYNQQKKYHCIPLHKTVSAKYLEQLWNYARTYDDRYHFRLTLVFDETVEEISDKDSGELWMTTFMPSAAHNRSIKSLEGKIEMYCDRYMDILTNNFDCVPSLDADAGITLRRGTHRDSGIGAGRRVLIELERTHRTLSDLHDHMVFHMERLIPVQFGIGIWFGIQHTAATRRGMFAAICLLYDRQSIQEERCFRILDFGLVEMHARHWKYCNEICSNVESVPNRLSSVNGFNRRHPDDNYKINVPASAIFTDVIHPPSNPEDLELNLDRVLFDFNEKLEDPKIAIPLIN